jgi:hypothetical protein
LSAFGACFGSSACLSVGAGSNFFSSAIICSSFDAAARYQPASGTARYCVNSRAARSNCNLAAGCISTLTFGRK